MHITGFDYLWVYIGEGHAVVIHCYTGIYIREEFCGHAVVIL